MPISIPTSVSGISIPGAVNGPLNALYGNKYSLGTYNYPRDLATNPTRKHVILFTINRADPSKNIAITDQDLSNIGAGLTQAGSGMASAVTKGISGDVSGAISEGIDSGSKAAEALKDPLSKVFATKVNRTQTKSIALYVPDSVNVSYDMKYQDTSLSEALGTAYYLAQGATSLVDTFAGEKDTAAGYINKAANNPFIRDFVGKAIGKALGTSGAAEIATQAGGYAFNPQLQVLFQGIGFREFQFDFILTPYSQEESKEIQNIIYELKYASAPEIKKNGWFNQGMYMAIPDTFNIKFMFDGKENPSVHKIGECVLTNISVDSAPNGWSTFADGSPVQYKMTLKFQETVIVDKTRISEGY